MSLHRQIILIFVAYYLPSYKSGGPVRTIANIVDHLGDVFDFKIICKDRDSFETKPYPKIKVNDWNQVGRAQVFYADPKFMTLLNVARLIKTTPHDVLYLNSFFIPRFTLLPLLARYLKMAPCKPCVIAPRGEFSKGAIDIKANKKKIFIGASKGVGLFRNLIWQASSKYESKDISREMGAVARQIYVAPNLPEKMADSSIEYSIRQTDSSGEPLDVVFLSRISPKKNLYFAIEVLSDVSSSVNFDIYGIIDDIIYWKKCEKLISKLPENICATYHGVVEHSQVAKTLTKYDLFFLPTRGENFGHVIYETLAVGTPALISDQTPWKDLNEKGVGWVLPLNEKRNFVDVIEAQSQKDKQELSKQMLLAKQYAFNLLMNGKSKNQNIELFNKAAAGEFI